MFALCLNGQVAQGVSSTSAKTYSFPEKRAAFWILISIDLDLPNMGSSKAIRKILTLGFDRIWPPWQLCNRHGKSEWPTLHVEQPWYQRSRYVGLEGLPSRLLSKGSHRQATGFIARQGLVDISQCLRVGRGLGWTIGPSVEEHQC